MNPDMGTPKKVCLAIIRRDLLPGSNASLALLSLFKPFAHALTMSQETSTFTMPDRLAADPSSKFFQQSILERDVGIRFNGVDRSDVEEYCISEGWIRVAAGKAVDRKGRPLLLKLKGSVEAWVKNPAP
jgi:Protein of unknown function (DUF3297)